MPKNIEENPFNIDREDEAQVNKNDIKKKNWSPIGYVPIDEVPDTEHTHLSEELPISEESEDEDREEKSEKEAERLKQEILKFHQGEGVASVGPDMEGSLVEEGEKGFKKLDVDPISTSSNIESMNPGKTISSDYEIRKYNKTNKSVAAGKDNLKTDPVKKEKGARAFIRRILKRA